MLILVDAHPSSIFQAADHLRKQPTYYVPLTRKEFLAKASQEIIQQGKVWGVEAEEQSCLDYDRAVKSDDPPVRNITRTTTRVRDFHRELKSENGLWSVWGDAIEPQCEIVVALTHVPPWQSNVGQKFIRDVEFLIDNLQDSGHEVSLTWYHSTTQPPAVFQRLKEKCEASRAESNRFFVLSPDQQCSLITRDYIEYMLTRHQMEPYGIHDSLEKLVFDLAESTDWPEVTLSDKQMAPLAGFKRMDAPVLAGGSELIDLVRTNIYRAAKVGRSMNVAIVGESGTGKEAAAFFLHEFSDEADKPYVPLNCGAIPDTLIESELFGYKKGSSSIAETEKPGILDQFVEAGGGTLFLDELPEMSLLMQGKLLRFLQTGEYSPIGATANKERKYAPVRIIAGLQPFFRNDPEGRKRIRDDLYYRIADTEIILPTLNELIEDLPEIIRALLYRLRGKQNWRGDVLDDAVIVQKLKEIEEDLPRLKRYDWREGNVRMLRRCIMEYCLLEKPLLGRLEKRREVSVLNFFDLPDELDKVMSEDEVVTRYVKCVFDKFSEKREQQGVIARQLGLSINTLKKRLDTEGKLAL